MDARDVSSHRPPNSSRPHVVIVGGGFGGLNAARGLARAPVHLTVVDQHNYHLFRPMLYQVATGLLSADEIAAPIRSILRKQKNTEVLMAEVIGVDTQHHLVQTRESDLPYDYLILATGSHYNYFGHDEWVTFAPGLHSVDDADLIRGKILRAFEDAERLATNGQADPDTLQALLTFILVGGGTAGVEMAGTIAEMARMALAHDFRHIDPRSARIVLFEAAPRILPGYPEQLSARAHHHLEQLGVQVRPGTKVEDVDASGVVVAGQRIGSRTVLWTAGVVASPAGQWLGVETDRAGRVKVQPDLSVPGHPNVFAIGDTASVVVPTARQIRREPRVKFSVNTVEAARRLVSAGLGIALQPASLLFLDERDRVTTVNVEGAWAKRSNRVGNLRGKALTPTAEAPMEQLWRDR
jgi:NADH:ubiquinone reductase (H+-translocating)